MQHSKLSIVLVLLAFAAPQVASAGEVVEFALKESELSSPEKREVLLKRMTMFAAKSCDDGSVFATKDAIAACTKDLTTQFVKKVDHDALSKLAKTRASEPYRSASR